MAGWRKILCPVDLSDLSRSAMAEALELARRNDGAVHLLHVLEPQAGAYRGEAWSAEQSTATQVDQAQRVVAAWLREAEAILPGRVTGEVNPGGGGGPADEVTRAAADGGYDLVVMGTHGRRGVRHLVLGSVAEAVVRGAPCSVLVVRPKR
ncbi:MAG TPA: universal stress protein [Anaeromyxobacteraceae bacterium]|nr:universal stress protein [Anaeromyxobacteraceae bacterium]